MSQDYRFNNIEQHADKVKIESLSRQIAEYRESVTVLFNEKNKLEDECIKRMFQIENYKKIIEQYRKLSFPERVLKLWTGAEVNQWLGEQHEKIAQNNRLQGAENRDDN